jgi:poly(A) polymerase/tRNA nucleotidyltransferase (CCA-adding enzyme)
MIYKIPIQILEILEEMEEAGFDVYLVGGCVRDILLGRVPKDWDITTNAKPEEIQKVFENTFYENDFGTVGVVVDTEDPTLKVVEITPYRMESKYTDKRHPDILNFTDKIENDLKRRDFTINAIALKISHAAYVYPGSAKEKGEVKESLVELVDLWEGRKDLKDNVIRTVGDPKDRFNEDALRIMRAVRLATELGFKIEENTGKALIEQARLLKIVSRERMREEFTKILMSDNPRQGVQDLLDLGLLKYIMPELEEGVGVRQNKEHIYTVWEHNIRSLGHAANKGFPLEVRMAALLHDIGKPQTKEGEGLDSTFYNHEIVGAKMTMKMLSRLRYPKKFTEKVIRLVRWHLFFSDTDIITLSAVRRIVRNVGPENIWDLMKVRFCDRVGMGRPKEKPYRLRKYEAMIEEALRSPLTVSMLKINGSRLMELTKIESGPKIGYILHALLEEVLDDPALNTKEYMEKRALEIAKLSEDEMRKLGTSGKQRKDKEEEKEITKIRDKYKVK